jgi:capsular exopolysaccharide synthesis family protein
LELLSYWKIIRKRLLLILLLVMVAEFAALYYVQSQTPLYQTTTTLIITPASLGSLLPYQVNLALGPLANTYIEFMRTRSFASQVAERMPVEISLWDVLASLRAEFQRDTQIFRITATHANPEVAQLLANTTAELLIESNRERQRSQQQARLDAQRSPEAQARQQQMEELTGVLQDELDYYDDQIQIIQNEVSALEQGPQSVETTQRILDLRNQLLQYRTERVDVLSSLAETQNALASAFQEPEAEVDTIVVVDPALLPTSPVGRDLQQPLVAAAVAALALGVGLAWFLDYVDYSVKSPEDLDELYDLPTQAAITVAPGAAAAAQRADTLVTVSDPRSPIAEAFRALRTSIRMSGAQTPVQSLLITSAGPSEGKTFIATNLAVAFAQEGKRIILVDLDLRKPQVYATFGLRREPGFTNLVVDRELPIERCLQTTLMPNLLVIPCGTLPPHPAELLGSSRAAEIMERIEAQADMVIYDSAPAATVTDAVLVAPRVDAVLQVVGARVARRDMVLRCKQLLERSGARLLGPVLNRVQTDELGYYANYYSYGRYYHTDSAKPVSGWRRLFGGQRRVQTAPAQPTAPAATYETPSRLPPQRRPPVVSESRTEGDVR